MNWFKSFWQSLNTPPMPQGITEDEFAVNSTPRARQVLALARVEADRMKHPYLGTEHLLLGLIRLGQGVAVNVLKGMDIDLEALRRETEKQSGTDPVRARRATFPALHAWKRFSNSPRRKPRPFVTPTLGRNISFWVCCVKATVWPRVCWGIFK